MVLTSTARYAMRRQDRVLVVPPVGCYKIEKSRRCVKTFGFDASS